MINDLVDLFISPSGFLYNKLIEYGIKSDKLTRLEHFTPFHLGNEEKVFGDYYLYVGRISEEKGVKTLIDAALKVNSSKLKIAGSGPMLKEMISYAKARDKKNIVEFLGHQDRKELNELYEQCKFIVIPSEWYENFPYTLIEAFTYGIPAIGSRIGGIVELIKDTERGILFETGNADDLSAAIRFLLKNPDIVEEMGKNARNFVTKELTAEKHYQKLIKIYENAILKHTVSIT
jgi:glycosyltransferase involved in cell wall biosynthesis